MRVSLSVKILVVLFVSVAIVMTAVIYLTVTHQTEEMLKEVTANSEETASTIYAGIKYPMSVGDSGAVEKQLLEIKDRLKNIEVFICDTNKKIVFSTHLESIKKDLDNFILNKNILDELSYYLKSGELPEKTFEEQIGQKKYLVHIHTVQNQEECFRCHGPQKKVLGAILLRKSADKNYAAIATLKNNNMFVSILGIFAVILISHTLMVRVISRPVKRLAADIRELPMRISDGSYSVMTDVDRTDEVGDMQNSFNHMASELNEKTKALERSNIKIVKANKELEAFAYSVSHDLRAPLRNIDGFSKILLDEFSQQLDEKAVHYLRRVRNGTAQMSLLIDDMLAFSKIGRTELHLTPVNCGNIVNSIIEYYSKEIEDRNISIEIGELPVVRCDTIMMQSLFSNLVANALKFTRNTDNPRITIGYDENIEAIYIKDNGVGFDMEYHDKIFQVFQRLHLPEEYDGTGIGLAIVKRVVERHKGSVWAESELKKGTTFFIKLPVYKEG